MIISRRQLLLSGGALAVSIANTARTAGNSFFMALRAPALRAHEFNLASVSAAV